MSDNHITCPNCKTVIDVNSILSNQLEQQISLKYESQRAKQNADLLEKEQKFKEDQLAFELKKQQENELFKQKLETSLASERKLMEEKLNAEKTSIEVLLKSKLENENKLRFESMQKELAEKSEKVQELHKSQTEIEKLKRENLEQKTAIEAEFSMKISEQLSQERIKTIASEAEKSNLKFQEMQKELAEKSEKVQELHKSQTEIEKLKRENLEQKTAIEAEFARKANEQLELERTKIIALEDEKNAMKFKELQKQIDDQKALTEEMKRKQAQGSMQLQGEVLELAVEEYLADAFPLDTIEEVKKGQRGGDCVQHVHTRTQQNCGSIYYESKRAKEWSEGWIEKFKADMRDKQIGIGVLVTEVMPKDMDRMGLREGVWVCNFEEFKGLSKVLRETVLKLSILTVSQENKGDKMSLLYDYLTSPTFKMQIEAIVEGFSAMKENLDSEKRAMARIWKEREKQLDKVIENTIDLYGSVRGIAGNAVQSIKALELGESLED